MTLHSLVCLVSMRGYQWPQGLLGTRDSHEILRDCSGNSDCSFCDDTFPLTQQVSYVSLWCLWGQMSVYVLEPLSQYTFRISQTQRVLVLCDLISYLGLETISSSRWEWTIQVSRSWVVVLFTLTIEIRPQTPWLELLGSSYAIFQYVIFFYDYVVVCLGVTSLLLQYRQSYR